ncbi:DNA internalization-related competence protein ComEC/Rec2 [Rheinheimera maricola]|uniref:DNA internalization-related competence protein ComEC/Rec2 n=1 Tax=Rheinheimera maricola TaxID=2793282 RepID=A0ABS7X547_9GAMM|nr:DNA internalization-related competence protein ComEC/Rec2 [Rheinheimera maricola]MBZ9610654.1 DNA internalization-related competence protein ComEC/Rec2 [Rheinheimera maricola]
MKSFCIGVLAGSLLSLFLPIVPPFFTVFLLGPLSLLLAMRRYQFLSGVAVFLCCWVWQLSAYQYYQQSLFKHTKVLQGVIVSVPKQYEQYSQFLFQLDNTEAAGYKVKLNWPQPPTVLLQGQRWQINARLKPVAGTANPAGPNTEAQALLQKVLAQGAVQTETAPQLLAQQQALRQQLIIQVQQATAALDSAPLLQALTLGVRQFSPQLWQGLQQSGLAHLLAISGLHIGLVFGWGLYILRLLPWPLSYLSWRQPSALLGALCLALTYAWLAGFAIPTLRAAFALLLLVLALLRYRRLSYSNYWLFLTASLLLLQPSFALSKSFWLSVLAVAVIFLLLWRWPATTQDWRYKLSLFVRFHCGLTLFMSLLSVLLFGGSPLLALLSNLLWLPWCSLVAIPMLFVSLVAELLAVPGAGLLWQATNMAFKPLLWWLNWCSEQNSWLALPDFSWLLLAGIALCAVLMLVAYQHWQGYLAAVLLIPLTVLMLRPVQWQLHVIDVGQGLAILLQHGKHGILYDAGPRYGQHSATAAQVLPYLRQRGVTRLDAVILSHDDSDHTGDWEMLRAYFPELVLYSDIGTIDSARPCQQLPTVYFGAILRVLQQGPGFSSKNDRSCILLIELYDWKLLIPGDIGHRAEQQLIARYPELKAHVLVLAHHGSGSSSHLAFLHQLAPLFALNSASLYNRHQHPAPAVQHRLQLLGIPLFNTAHSGAIRLNITPHTLQLQQYRQHRIPFWLQKPLGNAETLLTTR